MLDEQFRVVFDARAGVECTDQVVRLFAGGPGESRAEPELLVEVAHTGDEIDSQEHRVGDGAVPEVVARQDRRVALPRWRGAAAPGQAVEFGLRGEALRDALEEVVRIDAVVVGKRDEIRADRSECGVSRVGEATCRSQPYRFE